jgi:hypothetical protein
VSCLFRKATQTPWRTKAPLNRFRAPPTKRPGDVILAVDQLLLSTPGLIGWLIEVLFDSKKGIQRQLSLLITSVDTSMSIFSKQLQPLAAETLEGKEASERSAKAHGVTVWHYHADNGIFAVKALVHEVNQEGQTVSFCAMKAHHQNGKAEKRIRHLQETARTMLLGSKKRQCH